jgi:hypothetical protein
MNQRPTVENDRSVRGQSQAPHFAAFNWLKLANQGVDTPSLQHYLGHKNIQHTVRYSEIFSRAISRFLEGLGNDWLIRGGHLSGMRRRLPRLSQNVHPQRQHAAQPDGVVDVIGVGVAGPRMEQDAQTGLLALSLFILAQILGVLLLIG